MRRWPLLLIALGTFVAIWTGWVQLGAMTGFGWMHPLPGIIPGLRMNAVITLPVSVEAYGAYALGVWLAGDRVPDAARTFAKWSAIGALALGWVGQAASHVLTAAHVTVAPWPVTVIVSSVPVAAFGLAVALTHLLSAHGGPAPKRAPSRVRLWLRFWKHAEPAPVTVPVSAAAPVRSPRTTAHRNGKRKRSPDPLTVFATEIASGVTPSKRDVRERLGGNWATVTANHEQVAAAAAMAGSLNGKER